MASGNGGTERRPQSGERRLQPTLGAVRADVARNHTPREFREPGGMERCDRPLLDEAPGQRGRDVARVPLVTRMVRGREVEAGATMPGGVLMMTPSGRVAGTLVSSC